MKILWFSHFVPYPPRGGNRQRSFNLLRTLSREHQLHLLAFNLDNEPTSTLDTYKQEIEKLGIAVEFLELPVKWRSAKWALKLALAPFDRQPFSVGCFWSEECQRTFANRLREGKFDLVHFDSIDLAAYFDCLGGLPAALTHHNCESAMAARRVENSRNPLARFLLKDFAKKLKALEEEICPRVAVNIVVSEGDRLLLRQHSPSARIEVVDNPTDTSYFEPRPELLEEYKVVFCGSLKWYPNCSGLKWFLTEVWPLILAACPDSKFLIAGRQPSPSFQRLLSSFPRTTVVASPEDIRPYMAAGSVFVCPILDGGGTRLKLLDAMAMGKAIVSTSIGCEGLGVTNGRQMMIADPPQEFADQVVTLLRDRELRNHLQRSATAYAARYDALSLGRLLGEKYEQVLADSLRQVVTR